MENPQRVVYVPPGMEEIGETGLEQYSGVLNEEKLPQLRGQRAAKTFRQMADNDATVGAILYATEMLLRKVSWSVMPASDSPDDKENAEFLESCKDDMSQTWEEFISEIVSMLTFGWASTEIVYKRRMGPNQTDPTMRSKFDDGRIGWRKLPIRAQESLDRWEFDDDGGIQGWWQYQDQGPSLFLPIEKLLMFRTTSRKNNPEGRSMLRNAYVPWYRKKEIERIEAIGIERDLAGLPVLYLPARMLDKDASAETKAAVEKYKAICKNLRSDEQSCLILPNMYDSQGKKLVEFSLMSTGSRRGIDTNAIIERYKKDIATSIVADVVLLGHEKVGSFALAESKTHLFAVALGALLDSIESVLNRFAVTRLFKLNGIEGELPYFQHGDLEKPDLVAYADAITKLASFGGITPGSEADEKYLRELYDLPKDIPNMGAQILPETGTQPGKAAPNSESPADQAPSSPNPPPKSEEADAVEEATTKFEKYLQIVEILKAGEIIQSVIVSKKKCATRAEAESLVKGMDKKTYTSRETGTSFRFRQRPPEDFDEATFRTIELAEGVSAVVGKLK